MHSDDFEKVMNGTFVWEEEADEDAEDIVEETVEETAGETSED